MAEIRQCAFGWVYCDGNCSTCQKTTTTTTTSTTPPNFVTGTSHYPVSNADRIRAMSDEELAEYLIRDVEAEAIRRAGRYLTNIEIDRAVVVCLDWLKQEVDSDTT